MLRTNILVLGKSGAGKSSLLNYIWGDVVAKTGAGRPVTERSTGDETGIYKSEPIRVNAELELVIYDSWGMEANKADKWNEIIRYESAQREKSSYIQDWFHAVIYCVSAKGARIEEFEIKNVVQPLIDSGYAVIFALTKCGIASENERQSVRKVIESTCPMNGGIVDVESVPVTLRGRVSPTQISGKQALLDAAKDNFIANLAKKLQKNYLIKCNKEMTEWRDQVVSFYNKEASFFMPSAVTLKEVAKKADKWLSERLDAIDHWRIETDEQAINFYRVFGSVMLRKENFIGEYFLSRSKPLTSGKIKWDGVEHVTSVIINLIPIVNVGYWLSRKEIHRSNLEKKLTDIVDYVNDTARYGLERRF